jgi:hypothetical protein
MKGRTVALDRRVASLLAMTISSECIWPHELWIAAGAAPQA